MTTDTPGADVKAAAHAKAAHATQRMKRPMPIAAPRARASWPGEGGDQLDGG